MSSNNPFAKVKADAAVIEADATKVAADATVAKAAVVNADNKAIAWVKANPAKVVLIVLALVALLVWKIL